MDTQDLINVRVTQFYPGRLQVFRALIPLATLASLAVRRAYGLISVAIAVGLLVGMLVIYLRARRRFGWQPMRMISGTRCSLGTELSLQRQEVTRWTLNDKGSKAYLYCHDVTVRLQCGSTDAQRLRAQLSSWLGAPLALQKRGSPRARWIAFAVSVAGLALITAAIVFERVACVVAGVPLLILGAATFGALSQRIAQRTQSVVSTSEKPAPASSLEDHPA